MRKDEKNRLIAYCYILLKNTSFGLRTNHLKQLINYHFGEIWTNQKLGTFLGQCDFFKSLQDRTNSCWVLDPDVSEKDFVNEKLPYNINV